MTCLIGTSSAVSHFFRRCFERSRQKIVCVSNAELILFRRGLLLEILDQKETVLSAIIVTLGCAIESDVNCA